MCLFLKILINIALSYSCFLLYKNIPNFPSRPCMTWSKETKLNKLGKEARLELHKDGFYCFKQILETGPYKTAAVRLLTTNLINYPS